MQTHQFSVGQYVRLIHGSLNRGRSGPYKILQLMPYDGRQFEYRIKSVEESFDRVAKEYELSEMTSVREGWT